MKKSFIYLILLFVSLQNIHSQEKKWTLSFSVVNSFTQKSIPGITKAELMLPDSTVVDSTIATPIANFKLDGSQRDYILRLSNPDYDILYKNISLKYYKRKTWMQMEAIPMRKINKSEKEIMLGEVVVKATKIKFLHKGDTLVYNADAFQLAEGSMLDELISQLPGAELDENGKISINGKFIESLLLNGQDFFKGNNTVMLENLPAYMVKDLKVYNEESELSKMLGNKVDEGRYVMDVQLKRQYSIGWIANTEWGAGSENRYLGRLFTMRFTPQSRITLFGNMNNLNDNRKPGRNGDWSPSDLSGGLMTSKTGGLDYGVYDKHKHFKVEGNAQITHTDNNIDSETSTTNFLLSGNTYDYSKKYAKYENTQLTTSHLWELKGKDFHTNLSPNITYNKYNNRSRLMGGTFSESPFNDPLLRDSLWEIDMNDNRTIINRLKQEQLGNGRNLNANIEYFLYIHLPQTDDGMNITAGASYSERKNEMFDKYRLEYPNVQPTVRDRYFDTPYKGYSYNLETNYFYRPIFNPRATLMINPKYILTHRYNSTTNNLYRLDQMEGWNPEEEYPLGTLPSVKEDLIQLLDPTNSYESREHTTTNMIQLRMIYWGREKKDGQDHAKQEIGFYPTVVYEEKHFDYVSTKQQQLKNTAWLFRPRVEIKINTAGMKHEWKFIYQINTWTPSMMNLLDITFDSDPLNIRKGNPGLKNSLSHFASVDYRADKWFNGTDKMLNASTGYTSTHNAVAMGYIYDKTTGVKTITPENINGNWKIWFNTNFTTPIDKARKITLSSNTQLDYSDNADLVGINNAAMATKRIVHNLYFRETINTDYRVGNHRIGIKCRLSWTNATSGHEDFESINAFNINYGLTGQVNFPLNIQLSSDITMYSRRGYGDESMNTNELVWNARLTKGVMHGNLVFTLDGFDILGNLKKINYSLNGQGRTETWLNSIPRYVMLRAIYKLNIQPKKKS